MVVKYSRHEKLPRADRYTLGTYKSFPGVASLVWLLSEIVAKKCTSWPKMIDI